MTSGAMYHGVPTHVLLALVSLFVFWKWLDENFLNKFFTLIEIPKSVILTLDLSSVNKMLPGYFKKLIFQIPYNQILP